MEATRTTRWSSISLNFIRRSGVAGTAAGLALACFAVPVETRAADVAAADASTSLEEVIVTATRREEKLKDVPVSTSVLSGESLAVLNLSGQDIRQLAFSVPSLQIESSNGRTFPRLYIRGYGNTDFTSFASQPVSLVYDDIVQENPALKGFPVFDEADVEVLRGPQGTLFGRNSPAGVVKFESAKPVLGETSGTVSVSDGTYNTATVTGVANLPISDVMAFRASTQELHRDNWVYDPIRNSHLMGFDDLALRLQLLYKPSDTFSALFNIHGRALDGGGLIFRANIIQPGSNGALVPGFNPALYYGDGYWGQSYSSLGANAHLTWNLPAFTLQSITGYESIRHYSTQGDIDGGYGPGNVFCRFTGCANPPDTGPGQIPFSVETSGGIISHYQLTEELRAVSNQSGPLQGQVGVFLFYEDTKAFGNDYNAAGSILTDTTISQQKNNAEAIFGSLEYTVTPEFKARAGIRFTSDHKDFNVPLSTVVPPLPQPEKATASASNVSWDLSATYAVTPDVNLYARIATGFRAPSFGAPSAGPPPIPIQVARSENNISYETGVKADLFDRRARIAFDVYYYDVSHQQLTAVGGGSNITQLLNAAHSVGNGAELDFDATLVPNLVLHLSGSLNNTKIKDPGLAIAGCFNWSFVPGGAACTELSPVNAQGNALVNGDPLPEAPKYIVDLSLRYAYPMGPGSELFAFTDWTYRTKMNLFLDVEKEFTAQDLYQAGLRLGYTWNDKKYEVAAFCRNCTNVIKNIYGINFENFTGVINDPRVVGAQISARF